jgi:hypothetical protein
MGSRVIKTEPLSPQKQPNNNLVVVKAERKSDPEDDGDQILASPPLPAPDPDRPRKFRRIRLPKDDSSGSDDDDKGGDDSPGRRRSSGEDNQSNDDALAAGEGGSNDDDSYVTMSPPSPPRTDRNKIVHYLV